jgi:hypothetical protein
MSHKKVLILAGLFTVLFLFPAAGQPAPAEEEGPKFSFGLGIGIGVQSYANPDFVPGGTEPEKINYQSLSLDPEFIFGKFGIGLNLALNYRFTAGAEGDRFEVREEDWKAGDLEEVLDVYLPKIRYIRYGAKGDPLFIKMGTIDDAVLGNGFIVANYSNALFLPETRIFGLSLDLDGKLFGFPYIGIETFAANLARFDLIASRLYGRPLAETSLPLLDELQVGATVAVDQDPGYFADKKSDFPPELLPPSDASVLIYGIDFRLPLLSGNILSLATFGDGVFQQEGAGAMLGIGGRLVKFITYGAQLRFLGDNFIPAYFGPDYDLYRPEQYLVYDGVVDKKGGLGWFASLGFSVLKDGIVFVSSMEGPLGEIEGNYYNWRAVFMVKEGILPGFFFDASYDKKNMAGFDDFLRWKEEALIRARVNYRTGPAIISLVYNLRYDPSVPGDDKWQVTSGIESKITLY